MTSHKRQLSAGKGTFWLNVINILVLLAMAVLSAIHYGTLPDQIPVQFGTGGQPGTYADRVAILILPLIALFVSLLLFLMRRDSKLLNYPVPVTDANREALYQEASCLVAGITLLTNMLLLYAECQIIRIAQERTDTFEPTFAGLLVVLILVHVAYSYRQMKKLGGP